MAASFDNNWNFSQVFTEYIYNTTIISEGLRQRVLSTLNETLAHTNLLQTTGGNLKKTVTFGTKRFVHYSWHFRYLGRPLLGGFTVNLFYNRGPEKILSKKSLNLKTENYLALVCDIPCRGLFRTLSNIFNGPFCDNSSWFLAINYF